MLHRRSVGLMGWDKVEAVGGKPRTRSKDLHIVYTVKEHEFSYTEIP